MKTRQPRVKPMGAMPEAERGTASAELFVQESPVHGCGLYSRRPFARGERIHKISGKRIRARYDPDFADGPNWIGIGWEEWLVPRTSDPIMMMNHCCSPNAIISQSLVLMALRDIAAAEEIVLDYATTEVDPFWGMRCTCRHLMCRGWIRAFPCLDPETRKALLTILPRRFVRAVHRFHVEHVQITTRLRLPPHVITERLKPTRMWARF